MAERADPFDQLITACQQALDFTRMRIERTRAAAEAALAEGAARAQQADRIEAALTILTSEDWTLRKKKKPRGNTIQVNRAMRWTPERRAAQGVLTRERLAAKRLGLCPRCASPLKLDADPRDPGPYCLMCGHRPREVMEAAS